MISIEITVLFVFMSALFIVLVLVVSLTLKRDIEKKYRKRVKRLEEIQLETYKNLIVCSKCKIIPKHPSLIWRKYEVS